MFRIRNLVMPEKIHVDTGSTAVSFKTILAWGVIQINSSLEQEEWSKKFVNNRHESLSRSYKGENIDAVKDISWVMHMLINTHRDWWSLWGFFLSRSLSMKTIPTRVSMMTARQMMMKAVCKATMVRAQKTSLRKPTKPPPMILNGTIPILGFKRLAISYCRVF